MPLKIGELARRCGLSIRALHHYHAIGLLRPSARTPGGARLYGGADFQRLHRIQALKAIGCSLEEIRGLLDARSVDAVALLERQALQWQAQARRAQTLAGSLQHLARHLAGGGPVADEDWLNLLEMTALYGQHLGDDELQRLRSPARGTAARIEAQRAQLVAAVREAMLRGLLPSRAAARPLAWRWVRMVIALTSNDAALAAKLRALQEGHPRAQAIVGIDRAMLAWIDEAIVHARVHLFSRHMSAVQTDRLRQLQLAHHPAWPPLVAQVRAQMDAGTPCDAPAMQALAARWQQLFNDSYAGGDPALATCVRQALAQEPLLSLGVGVDDALLHHMQAAFAALASTAATGTRTTQANTTTPTPALRRKASPPPAEPPCPAPARPSTRPATRPSTQPSTRSQPSRRTSPATSARRSTKTGSSTS